MLRSGINILLIELAYVGTSAANYDILQLVELFDLLVLAVLPHCLDDLVSERILLNTALHSLVPQSLIGYLTGWVRALMGRRYDRVKRHGHLLRSKIVVLAIK